MDDGVVLSHLVGGRYRLTDLIGQGAMGEVYRAIHESTQAQLAVKVLTGARLANPRAQSRFELEARNAAALNHPNILHVFDYGLDHQFGPVPMPSIVMELVEGRSLADELDSGPPAWRRAANIASQVLACALPACNNVLGRTELVQKALADCEGLLVRLDALPGSPLHWTLSRTRVALGRTPLLSD